MIELRRSEERGKTKTSWLESAHSFSFGEYRDPQHMHFGALRVINEDTVLGGGGFAPHPHRDMEIVTYILSGALQHRDSLANGSIIQAGEIQRMSAGTGIVHSEFNASKTDPVHFLQIWIIPSRTGLAPSYEQKQIDETKMTNRFARLAGPSPSTGEVRIVQDAEIFGAKLDAEASAIHALGSGRRAWVQIARGNVSIGNMNFKAGDAAMVTDQDEITVVARESSELLLFDLA